MKNREEFEQLDDRRYEILVKVANALEVSADEIYYNDYYLETMEKLADKVEELKSVMERRI
jgi:hypothetical protein